MGSIRLTASQIEQISTYLALLVKWNARTNLTAIRDPEEMVRRHFGESLFAAGKLYPSFAGAEETLIDFGSGAGFPGIPIRICVPELHVILIESHNKKATFLREVIRTLGLKEIQVHMGRAEDSGLTAKTVTMRAVEKFEQSLPVAASLVEDDGRLALLIGAGQVGKAKSLVPSMQWDEPVKIPGSEQRVLLIGNHC
jgi:16S rRNA (guanine527-N7)-methyltransferase